MTHSALKFGQLSAKVGHLGAESLDLLFLVSLLHVLTSALGLNLLDLELVPRIHVVAVSVHHLVVFVTNIANSIGQLVLEELAVLTGSVTSSEGLQFLDFLKKRSVPVSEKVLYLILDTLDEIDFFKKSCNLVLVVNTVKSFLVKLL